MILSVFFIGRNKNIMKITYDELCERLIHRTGLKIITTKEDFDKAPEQIAVSNGLYTAILSRNNALAKKNDDIQWFASTNPYVISNINVYLKENHQGWFECISDVKEFKNGDSILNFKCVRCGEIIKKSLRNLKKKDITHEGIVCPRCDKALESKHALVLKQMFLHYYPDTIIEDKSCRNPLTNAIMPTDIVNHNMKLAIEVQGQFHKLEAQKIRDKIKREYWLNRGYTVLAYEIDGVSVLDYVKIFFPEIDEIPDWVNMNYSCKLDLISIQKKLNDGMKVLDIAQELNINPHRIYDALQNNQLYYPKNYIKSTRRPVVQLNKNKEYMNTYSSYADAERDNGIKKGLIGSCIFLKRYYSSGYYWIPLDLYETNNYTLKK